MGPDAMIFVFWMLSFKPTFSLSTFTFIKRLFSSSSLDLIYNHSKRTGNERGVILQSKSRILLPKEGRRNTVQAKQPMPNTPFLFSTWWDCLLIWHFLYITFVLSHPTITSSCPGKVNYSFYICVSNMYYIITFTVLQQRSCDVSACLWETASSREKNFHPTDTVLLPALPLFLSYPVTLFLMPTQVTYP